MGGCFIIIFIDGMNKYLDCFKIMILWFFVFIDVKNGVFNIEFCYDLQVFIWFRCFIGFFIEVLDVVVLCLLGNGLFGISSIDGFLIEKFVVVMKLCKFVKMEIDELFFLWGDININGFGLFY